MNDSWKTIDGSNARWLIFSGKLEKEHHAYSATSQSCVEAAISRTHKKKDDRLSTRSNQRSNRCLGRDKNSQQVRIDVLLGSSTTQSWTHKSMYHSSHLFLVILSSQNRPYPQHCGKPHATESFLCVAQVSAKEGRLLHVATGKRKEKRNYHCFSLNVASTYSYQPSGALRFVRPTISRITQVVSRMVTCRSHRLLLLAHCFSSLNIYILNLVRIAICACLVGLPTATERSNVRTEGAQFA